MILGRYQNHKFNNTAHPKFYNDPSQIAMLKEFKSPKKEIFNYF